MATLEDILASQAAMQASERYMPPPQPKPAPAAPVQILPKTAAIGSDPLGGGPTRRLTDNIRIANALGVGKQQAPILAPGATINADPLGGGPTRRLTDNIRVADALNNPVPTGAPIIPRTAAMTDRSLADAFNPAASRMNVDSALRAGLSLPSAPKLPVNAFTPNEAAAPRDRLLGFGAGAAPAANTPSRFALPNLPITAFTPNEAAAPRDRFLGFGTGPAAPAAQQSGFNGPNTKSVMFNPLIKGRYYMDGMYQNLSGPDTAAQTNTGTRPPGARRGPVQAPVEDPNAVEVQRGLTTTKVSFDANGLPVQSGPINDTFEAQLQRARNIDSEAALFDAEQASRIGLDAANWLLTAQENSRERRFNAGDETFQPAAFEQLAASLGGRNVNPQTTQAIANAEQQRIQGQFGVQQAQLGANATVAAANAQAAEKIQQGAILQELRNPNITPERAAVLNEILSNATKTSGGAGARSAASDRASGRTFLTNAFENGSITGVTPADQAFALSLVDRGLASPEGALAEVYKRIAARKQPQ